MRTLSIFQLKSQKLNYLEYKLRKSCNSKQVCMYFMFYDLTVPLCVVCVCVCVYVCVCVCAVFSYLLKKLQYGKVIYQ
jgi:hypothetical protein